MDEGEGGVDGLDPSDAKDINHARNERKISVIDEPTRQKTHFQRQGKLTEGKGVEEGHGRPKSEALRQDPAFLKMKDLVRVCRARSTSTSTHSFSLPHPPHRPHHPRQVRQFITLDDSFQSAMGVPFDLKDPPPGPGPAAHAVLTELAGGLFDLIVGKDGKANHDHLQVEQTTVHVDPTFSPASLPSPSSSPSKCCLRSSRVESLCVHDSVCVCVCMQISTL